MYRPTLLDRFCRVRLRRAIHLVLLFAWLGISASSLRAQDRPCGHCIGVTEIAATGHMSAAPEGEQILVKGSSARR